MESGTQGKRGEHVKIMLVAGDVAGDSCGADLAKTILHRIPQARLFGMGGNLMKEAGVRLLFNPTTLNTLGLVEGVIAGQIMRRVLTRLGEVMERHRPDVVVLIDFPQFNLKLGQVAKSQGLPVLFYLGPASWPNSRFRPPKVLEATDKVLSVFPFDGEPFRKGGVDVSFIGHPIVDKMSRPPSKAAIRKKLGIAEETVINYCPGHRLEMVKKVLPLMVKAGQRLLEEKPEVRFLLPLAVNLRREDVLPLTLDLPTLKIVDGPLEEVLPAGDLTVCSCGSISLVAAFLEQPLIAFYRAPTWSMGRFLKKREGLCLPNYLAQKPIVPELDLADTTPEKLAAVMLELLDDQTRRAQMAQDLRQVAATLGPPGALDRVVDTILALGAPVKQRGHG
ncbi:MAG: lipid-A-disaccharide synthase [Limnochordia bacterium]